MLICVLCGRVNFYIIRNVSREYLSRIVIPIIDLPTLVARLTYLTANVLSSITHSCLFFYSLPINRENRYNNEHVCKKIRELNYDLHLSLKNR